MLEFLMYKLEGLLPEDEFSNIISEFSIGKAQIWLDRVKQRIGLPCYDKIRKEFREQEARRMEKLSGMNCSATRKTVGNHKTIFQTDVGADKHPNLDGVGVDDLFTGFFVGV